LYFEECIGLLVNNGALRWNQIVSGQIVSPLESFQVPGFKFQNPTSKHSSLRSHRSSLMLKLETWNLELETIYRLARRGRNERVKAARGGVARANGLLAISLFLPPNAGNTTRATVCPVSRSIARIDTSSTGVTIVIARPVLPARPVRPMRCT
jgi:hypothetical protein